MGIGGSTKSGHSFVRPRKIDEPFGFNQAVCCSRGDFAFEVIGKKPQTVVALSDKSNSGAGTVNSV